MNVLQLPYLYRDSEHMWRVLDGEILRECARESAEYERVLWKDREEQSRQTAIANGTCVSTLSAEKRDGRAGREHQQADEEGSEERQDHCQGREAEEQEDLFHDHSVRREQTYAGYDEDVFHARYGHECLRR